MRNTIKLIFILIFLFSFIKCQKEDPLPPIDISADVLDVSEFGISDGSIDVTVTGGVAPFTFLWSTNDTAEDMTNIPAGVYWIRVMDSESQVETDTFEVFQPAPDSLTVVFNVIDPSQTGESDGIVETLVAGGYPPYTYSWSNGCTEKDADGLSAGTYALTIQDSRGQSLTESVSLTDVVVDVDGNIYSIQKIGDQVWMKENLRVTHASDSSDITSYIYQDNPQNENKYGRLYTWYVAMNGSAEAGAQGICPCGWHLPSDEEFKELEMNLGMTQAEADMVNTWRGSPAGTMLKAGGTSGYDALLSGRRSSNGSYSLMGRMEYMWTSSEYSSTMAWRRCLDHYSTEVGRWNTFPKSYGFSVRCVKDD